jgi:uncharacterized coiled-coil protein SlyX
MTCKTFASLVSAAAIAALLAFAPTLRAVTPAPDGGYANNNTAEGTNSLLNLGSTFNNTGLGFDALFHDTTGGENTGVGASAAFSVTTGNFNTAVGWRALFNNGSGSSNIAIGVNAGQNIISLSNNIEIGNDGTTGDFNTIRIGTEGLHKFAFIAGISGVLVSGVSVCVTSDGELGECAGPGQPQASASKVIQKLEEQASRIAEQDKAIKALTANLKEQSAQIQKVSAELAVAKAKPTLVANQK